MSGSTTPMKQMQFLNIVLLISAFALGALLYGQGLYTDVSDLDLHRVTEGWTIRADGKRGIERLDTAAYRNYRFQSVAILRRQITQADLDRGYMMLHAREMNVAVVVDGEMIYQFGGFKYQDTKDRIDPAGTYWHVVRLPQYVEEDELTVFLTLRQGRGIAKLPYFYMGGGHAFLVYMMLRNIPSLVLVTLMLSFALVTIGFYVLNSKRLGMDIRVLDFGFFVLGLTMWFALDNLCLKILYRSHMANILMLGYLTRGLYLLPLVLVFIHYPGNPRCNRLYSLVVFLVGYLLVRIVLAQHSGVGLWEYRSWDTILEMLCILSLGYHAVLLHEHTRRQDAAKLALLVWMYFGGYLLNHALNIMLRERVSHLGFEFVVVCAVFFFVVADQVKLALGSYRESLSTQYYQQMSMSDALTGLHNRDRYLERSQEITDLEGVALISLDLNDLKLVNDTEGHLAGDRLLVSAAERICEVFGSEFERFRVGGNEFLVIARGKSEEELMVLLMNLQERIRLHNESQAQKLSIAAGVAVYDPSKDRSFVDLMRRSDQQMYKRKIAMKAMGSMKSMISRRSGA